MTGALALLLLAALIAGISKTSFGGLGAIAVALLAVSMPTKESTAAALLLLIVGDLVAVARYRRSANWGMLKRLLPAVVPGLLLGSVFIYLVDDLILKRSIGALLMISVLIHIVLTGRRRRVAGVGPGRPSTALTWGAGIGAGFTTMTANAAGPVMALYLQLARVDKLAFLGTFSWFFFIVNVAKTPFTAALGLFTPEVLRGVAIGTPVVLVGTALGILVIRHVSQRVFDAVTIVTSLVAAAALLVI
ncbi:sulfite exporter TauE/SafE family protein [Tessaracoccus sp. MC1756]|uniref:sulfite exporter TauE/SafE family protein n=1 Tax=Tessaracoccus sp. MC1756 TaxID=2760311 RepID=UPI00160235A2|nr:sulfite exporter TauE/SafE family protein [Tessaracoccus sp. MC1756]MBB1510927.1 sulfite exporter TauE/SafE family protein [Tessaracoccus sp. MC1756]